MTANAKNRNEQWKKEKDGLAILTELEQLAEKDFSELDPGDVERLKWAGIYAQRPRDGHFLVRVKLPSGTLSSAQAEVLADLAHAYGKDEVQITIRQAVQIHNITLRDAVAIRQALAAAGLSSVEACGDVPRTILGNPLMGVDPEELLDTTQLVEEIYRFFLGNRDFSNLPRKFKVSISANPHLQAVSAAAGAFFRLRFFLHGQCLLQFCPYRDEEPPAGIDQGSRCCIPTARCTGAHQSDGVFPFVRAASGSRYRPHGRPREGRWRGDACLRGAGGRCART